NFALRAGGLAPVASLPIAIVLGLVITTEGWSAYRAQRWLLETLPSDASDNLVPISDKIKCLQAAASVLPHSARLHVLLGQAYEEMFDEERTADERRLVLSRGLLAL